MKAAVLYGFGEVPRYEDYQVPKAVDGELKVTVKAVVLDCALKTLASGNHFASRQLYPAFPTVAGRNGVGTLDDGTLVSFQLLGGSQGALSETVFIKETFLTRIPLGVDPIQATVIPSAAQSSLLPLKYKARLQPGETILINGATSSSGTLAVQIAKALGAGRIVATGRNRATGESLKALGADSFICLDEPEDQIAEAFRREAGSGYDVVLDYLGGRPSEILLSTFIPSAMGFASRRIRYIVTGGLAGSSITLPSQAIITSCLEIHGFGTTNTPENMQDRKEGVSMVWELIRTGKIKLETLAVPLSDIENAWDWDQHGKRLVIVPDASI